MKNDAFDDLAIQTAIDDFEAVMHGTSDEKHDAFILIKRHTPTIMHCLRQSLALLSQAQPDKLSDAPCDKCGYNGPGYYQPSTHPCAAKPAPTADRAEALRTMPDRYNSDAEPFQSWVKDNFDTIKAHLSAPTEWRPIETAPRDGKSILLYFPNHGVYQGSWHQPGNPKYPGFWACRGHSYRNATHWQPLPAAPSEVGGENG